jgi:hypothetical protein
MTVSVVHQSIPSMHTYLLLGMCPVQGGERQEKALYMKEWSCTGDREGGLPKKARAELQLEGE